MKQKNERRRTHWHHAIWVGLLLIWGGFAPQAVFSQASEVTAEVDSQKILIGDHLGYTLRVKRAPNRTMLGFPDGQNGLGPFEVLEIHDTTQNGNHLRRYTLTVFDSGNFTVPAQWVLVGDDSLRTNPIPVRVDLVAPVDTTQDIRPLVGLQEMPVSFREVLPYLVVLLLLVLIAAAILGYRYWKRRRPESAEEFSEPPIPAHELATSQLAALEAQQLWQQGELKAYFAALSLILRNYLEGRYHVPAPESVTDEIRAMLPATVPPEARDALFVVLETADLAKYAKHQPTPETCRQAMELARDFVAQTKPQETLSPETETEAD